MKSDMRQAICDSRLATGDRILMALCFVVWLSVGVRADDLECTSDSIGVIEAVFTPDTEYDEIEITLHDELLETLTDGPYPAGDSLLYEIAELTVPQFASVCFTGLVGVVEETPTCCNLLLLAEPVAEVELTPEATLDPDETPYIGFFVFDEDVVVADLEVDLEVSHPSISNLEIFMSSPDGTTVVLHDNNGGSGWISSSRSRISVESGMCSPSMSSTGSWPVFGLKRL